MNSVKDHLVFVLLELYILKRIERKRERGDTINIEIRDNELNTKYIERDKQRLA
jgi:hypothetical protein